jgi:hypothetical protein
MRMAYEDDRDADGNLTQSPWWECANCEERIGIAETGPTDEQLVKALRYPNREWTDECPHWRRDTAPDKWTLCFNQMDFGAVSCEYNEKYHGGHYTWFLKSRLNQFPQSIEQGKAWLEAFFREWAKAFMANGGKPANAEVTDRHDAGSVQ